MRPYISLCMIVKDEEKVIERCLSSVAHLVDEVVIVDTGSTDNTKEIVAKYTTNIYDFQWVNDFSAARNYAASKATGEWILVLDADEYVDEANFKDLIQEIKCDEDKYDAYYAKILNFAGSFGESLVQNYHDRIYKNNGEISYYRKIHEQFQKNNGEALKSKNSCLLIFHSGYLKQTVSEKQKNHRNKVLLDSEMNRGSNKAFDYFNLGNEYCSIGDYNKALESYLEAYKLKSDFRLAWVSTTLIQIIICLVSLKRYNDALSVIKDAENIYNDSPEFLYLKGEVFFLRGQMEEAKSTFLQLVNQTEMYGNILFRPDLKDQKPHIRLAEIFLHQEDFNGAIYHYTSVLNVNKYNEEAIKKIVFILNKFHSVDEISSFLMSNELVNSKNIQSYVRVCFESGNLNLAISLLANFYEENKVLYKIALLKKFCIGNEGNIEEFKEILQFEVLKELIESNWINIIDLYLLKEIKSEDNICFNLFSPIEENERFKNLKAFLSSESIIVDIDEDLLIFSLQMLIYYKKYSLIDALLADIENADKKVISKVASVLFLNGYKIESLQLYDIGDWNYFREEDFINIIFTLLDTNDKLNAVEFAKYAKMTFENDFRFYEYILENTNDSYLFKTVLEEAKLVFGDSFYAEKYCLLN
jgi:glycosyltransferase involved in cell wall biosynthesis